MPSSSSPVRARQRCWRALLLCGLTACGRIGFGSHDVDGDGRPSTAPPDTNDGSDSAPAEAGASDRPDPELDAEAEIDTNADGAVRPDAALADAGARDGVDASAAAGCSAPPAGSFWCADFDTAIPSGSYVDEYRGTATLVKSPAYRGSGSLAANVTGSKGYAAVAVDLTGLQAPTLHARAYAFIGSGVIADDFTILHLGHWSNPLGGTDLDITGGELESFSYADSSVVKSNVSVPRDQWFCLQLSVDVASQGGAVRVSLDGQLIIDGIGLSTLPAEGITDFAVGLPWTGQQQPALSVFIDEVAIGPMPIACL